MLLNLDESLLAVSLELNMLIVGRWRCCHSLIWSFFIEAGLLPHLNYLCRLFCRLFSAALSFSPEFPHLEENKVKELKDGYDGDAKGETINAAKV